MFDNPDTDSLAFVDDTDMNGKWRIAINLAGYKDSSPKEQRMTIIHELAHVLSLNSSQISQHENCTTLQLDEGCANPRSYINQYYQLFWRKLQQPVYSKNNFVTEYAATNETEDFAESFAIFMLEKQISSSLTTRDKKISFFYNCLELISIRKDIRSTLLQDIVRNRNINSSRE